jgi:hypothetical protein
MSYPSILVPTWELENRTVTRELVVWLLVGAGTAAGISWKIARAVRMRRNAEASRTASEVVPASIEATGSLAVQHQDETPETGRGAVRMSARGVMWQIPGGWKGGGGSAPWQHVDSVERSGIALKVVWGSSSGRTTLQYRGQGAPRLEGMARRHLTAPGWTSRGSTPHGGRRDSQWSRRDGFADG